MKPCNVCMTAMFADNVLPADIIRRNWAKSGSTLLDGSYFRRYVAPVAPMRMFLSLHKCHPSHAAVVFGKFAFKRLLLNGHMHIRMNSSLV